MTQETRTTNRQAMAGRLSELRETADRLDAEPRMRGEPPHGWVARLFHDNLAAKLEEERALELTRAEKIEMILLSGLVGWPLQKEMTEQCAADGRADIIWGATTAVSKLQGLIVLYHRDKMIAEAERDAALAELATLKMGVAA